ncbi:hypothetical protein M0811_14783 [Anaeramoeba ignava]|uniref:DDE Tnp4 domain-containing protein n=1 Tax=Anaeramoeba ignava TaxID=1746090 RepID=A0A9Q0LRX3_ANAIG|nr:hypothetical protein M0811_14783 [Anaeramoeba ignava]
MESLLVRGYLYLVADALLYPRTKNYPRNFFFQFSDSEEEIRDFDSIKFEELQATNNEQRLEILTNFGFQDFLKYSLMVDKAYYDLQNEIQIVIPFKKPRGCELNQEEQFFNARLSSLWIQIEHYYGRLKVL